MKVFTVDAPEHGIMSLFISASRQLSRFFFVISASNLSINQFPNKEMNEGKSNLRFLVCWSEKTWKSP